MQLRYAGLAGALEARCELVIRDAPHALGENEHEVCGARERIDNQKPTRAILAASSVCCRVIGVYIG